MSSTMPVQQKPLQSAPELLAVLPGGLNPVDLWLNLHTAQASWERVEDKVQRDNIIASTRLMLESLADFPVSRWLAFNHAIGWFPAAITATTWCQGAALAQCVSVWNDLNLMPKPEPGADFAARLINPALLPELSIMAISEAAGRRSAAGALLIGARDEAPALDFANAETVIRRNFPRELAQMLALRGAIPCDWVRQGQSGTATSNAVSGAGHDPQIQARRSLEDQVAAALGPRKEARGWADDQIAAVIAGGEAGAVAGFPHGPALRYVEPETGRSVVADETGMTIHAGRTGYIYSDMVDRAEPFELPPMENERAHVDTKAEWTTIYVPLKNEMIDVWRPVRAQRQYRNVFFILPEQEFFPDEQWRYGIALDVICEARRTGDGMLLLATGYEPRRSW